MLEDLLKREGSFTLFVAPPAWGKTRMLLELHHKKIFRILFISPLRALAQDFYKALEHEEEVVAIEKYRMRFRALDRFLNGRYGLLITTAEMLDDFFLDQLPLKNMLVVFDEFHLFYYWGQSFRENLFELLMGITNRHLSILGLSATISNKAFSQWKRDFLLGAEEIFYLDLGNQKLKYPPSRINYYCNKNQLIRRFLWSLTQKRKRTLIYFCAYRSQVDWWVKFCKDRGLIALGCKGGEVFSFVKDLEQFSRPDIIFATTALSHGVNLPPVEEIYIDYPVSNFDFWVQMVGRGGRKGENYQLFCRDRYLLSGKLIFKSIVIHALFDVVIRGGLYFRLCKPR